MKTISELIKENKLFTGKVYQKLKPVERDAIHDIIKFVEEDKSKMDYMSKFDKWIDNVCEKYNVRSVPTLLLFKDGKEIKRLIGARSLQELIEFIN